MTLPDHSPMMSPRKTGHFACQFFDKTYCTAARRVVDAAILLRGLNSVAASNGGGAQCRVNKRSARTLKMSAGFVGGRLPVWTYELWGLVGF